MKDDLAAIRSAALAYPPGHPDHYRRVLALVEEIGIECRACRCSIDAADVLEDILAGFDPRVGEWTCGDCGTT